MFTSRNGRGCQKTVFHFPPPNLALQLEVFPLVLVGDVEGLSSTEGLGTGGKERVNPIWA